MGKNEKQHFRPEQFVSIDKKNILSCAPPLEIFHERSYKSALYMSYIQRIQVT